MNESMLEDNLIAQRIHDLRSMLDEYEGSQTECDGRTRIIHTALTRENIPHQCIIGECRYNAQTLGMHFWIDLLGDLEGWRIDYCLRMWFGDENELPHGVFHVLDFTNILYKGASVQLLPLPDWLFQILIRPFE